MVNKCVVKECTSNYLTGVKKPAFLFPKDEDLRKRWIYFMNQKDWLPSQDSVICCLHFEPKYIKKENMVLYKIEGFVAKGFERVRKQFETNFLNGIERCAQLCVYLGDEVVIDLWGSVTECTEYDGELLAKYDGDSLTTVFSSTKNLAALCMATLVDRNLLSYDDKVIDHWPEFAENDDAEKQSLTIADILRHEGGMANFSKTLRFADLLPENIKKNSVGKVVEKEKLKFPPPSANTKCEYHGITRGWILNEIFRRVDTEGRTIGEALNDLISGPLNADCYIGLKYEQLDNSFPYSYLSTAKVLGSSFIPKALGRKTEVNAIDIAKVFAMFPKDTKNVPALEGSSQGAAGFLQSFQISSIKIGECPSANGQCSARGLAKIGAMIVNDGSLKGVEIFSKETCKKFHDQHNPKTMYPFGWVCDFSQGGVNYFGEPPAQLTDQRLRTALNNRNGYIGWMGLGGSIFQWRFDHKISIAYVPTFLAWEDFVNTRGGVLQKLVVDCVKDLQQNVQE